MTEINQTTAATLIAAMYRGHYTRSLFAKVKAVTTWQEMESLIDTYYMMPANQLSFPMISAWNCALRYGMRRNKSLRDEETVCKPGCISCAFEAEHEQMAYAGDDSQYEDDNQYQDDNRGYYDDDEPRDWYWNDGGGYCDW